MLFIWESYTQGQPVLYIILSDVQHIPLRCKPVSVLRLLEVKVTQVLDKIKEKIGRKLVFFPYPTSYIKHLSLLNAFGKDKISKYLIERAECSKHREVTNA